MARIELDRISKRYPDGTVAVAPTSLAVEDGEYFILVGPSGCGKSTLLNMIVGLTEPTGGEVRVDGAAVTARDPRERNMAMVFQSYAVYPHMTVRENMAFPLRLAGMARRQADERVARAAEMLGLEALLDRRPGELSGGQRQRVAMGRAVVREPVAFLLDEPLSNLDAKLRVQMRGELARLHRRLGTTTIHVTHDQAEAMILGDRVAVLRAGTLQQVGTPRELYETPANLFVAGFMGAPAMGFLPGRVGRAGRTVVLPLGEVPVPAGLQGRLAPGERVVAGMRPEHFVAAEAGGADTGPAFDVRAELVEWLGPDLYLHFHVAAETAALGHLAGDLPPDSVGDGRVRLVARLAPASHVAADATLRLRLDAGAISYFDPAGGQRLDRAGAV